MTRVAAGCGSSHWLVQRARHAERELLDRDLEAVPVLGDEEVAAAHRAGGRGDLAAAGVLEAGAGFEQRLLPDYAEVP